MELFLILVAILQSSAISLGMGGSTFAILNFFAAIADGIIDESERNLMGIVYIVLRIVMVLILITTATLTIQGYATDGVAYFSGFILAIWTLILVLYANAIAMTAKVMPSTVGPALQASSWYTLGVLMALQSLRINDYPYIQFLLFYAAAIVFTVSLINGVMAYLKQRKAQGGDTTESAN